MTSKLAIAFAALVITSVVSAESEPEISVTLGVVPQKNVQMCEVSRISTKAYVTDYAWTVTGLEDVIEYHQDQRLRVDLDTLFKPQNFPAENITFHMFLDANYSNPDEPRLHINTFYGPRNFSAPNDLIMYKFQVALKVGQSYYVHPNTSRPSSRWNAFPKIFNPAYTIAYDLYSSYNLTRNYWSRFDWSSSLGRQDGILYQDIKDLFASAQQEQDSPPNAITFIFKVTALQFIGAPILDVETKACGAEEEQVMTFDSLVENGFGAGRPIAQ